MIKDTADKTRDISLRILFIFIHHNFLKRLTLNFPKKLYLNSFFFVRFFNFDVYCKLCIDDVSELIYDPFKIRSL